jgi:hypothetical protein
MHMGMEAYKSTRTLLALGTAAGSLLLTGCGGKPNAHNCERAVSKIYSGDHSTGVTNDSGTWKLGILATSQSLKAEIRIGFKDPHNPASKWKDSQPISPFDAQKVGLKIGPGDVELSTQYAVKSDSDLCKVAPQTTFGDEIPLSKIPGNTVSPNWNN